MEMHQIRYFLAVAKTLNFTRAAEECHVAQPSLTRAIKLLEGEFGGELFRRERNLSHLTELGERMLPLMQQCYDSAHSAKSLASSIKSGEVATLKIALSRTISIELMVPHLTELTRIFKGLELKFVRGTVAEVVDALKKGDAELGIACASGETWDRLDTWPLFSETFNLVTNQNHRLAGRNSVDLEELREERLLTRPYCESNEQFSNMLRSVGIVGATAHQIATDNDVVGLLTANVGVAVMPLSTRMPSTLRRVPIASFEFQRTVNAYAVAGRPRAAVATTFLKLLRSADWPVQAAA
jgi:DNA-binding transcriptional LysR family regulator